MGGDKELDKMAAGSGLDSLFHQPPVSLERNECCSPVKLNEGYQDDQLPNFYSLKSCTPPSSLSSNDPRVVNTCCIEAQEIAEPAAATTQCGNEACAAEMKRLRRQVASLLHEKHSMTNQLDENKHNHHCCQISCKHYAGRCNESDRRVEELKISLDRNNAYINDLRQRLTNAMERDREIRCELQRYECVAHEETQYRGRVGNLEQISEAEERFSHDYKS